MKYIFITLVAIVFLGTIGLPEKKPTASVTAGEDILNLTDYGAVRAIGDHDTNTCRLLNNEKFNVLVVYPDFDPETLTIGMWSPEFNTISLMQPGGLNIEVVAHEVSHMVDTFMDRYQVKDDHYRAYMQGYWTDCVYKILQRDLHEAAGKVR